MEIEISYKIDRHYKQDLADLFACMPFDSMSLNACVHFF